MQTEYPAAQQYFKIVHINKIGILYRHFPYRQIQNMFGIRFRLIFHMQNDAVFFRQAVREIFSHDKYDVQFVGILDYFGKNKYFFRQFFRKFQFVVQYDCG